MNLISRFKRQTGSGETTPRNSVDDVAAANYQNGKTNIDPEKGSDQPIRIFRLRIIAMVLIVSLGGMIFGYDTGQISGFLEMRDFLQRFGNEGPPDDRKFSSVRSGTIVGLLSIGTLVGAVISAPIANKFGRRICIIVWNIVFIVGVIVQITTDYHWYQIVIGRAIAGLGVGGLSVLTPMYQAEVAPRQVRGALISCYQLFITCGIWLANCINYGTEATPSARSWRLPMGIGFIFPVLMIVGICFLRESPRWEYRHGKIDSARLTVAKSYGVPEDHYEVQRELREIKEKLEAENVGGSHPFYEVFTGPRMLYRVLLGCILQSLQQLTGANFFFYYGTTIFEATSVANPYVVSIILSSINFGTTFLALYVVEHFGRRKALISGGLWMSACFFIFASVGAFALNSAEPRTTPHAGVAMIVFACLFIFAYAMTWGPIIWCIVGEIYPTRYRAQAIGLASASNWIWNFCISFFTPLITGDIGFKYGYIFASCCFAGSVIVYFFLCESQGRTLEEIDTMYLMHVKPWQSSKWEPPEEAVTTDSLNLTSGGRGIRKERTDEQRMEGLTAPQPETIT